MWNSCIRNRMSRAGSEFGIIFAHTSSSHSYNYRSALKISKATRRWSSKDALDSQSSPSKSTSCRRNKESETDLAHAPHPLWVLRHSLLFPPANRLHHDWRFTEQNNTLYMLCFWTSQLTHMLLHTHLEQAESIFLFGGQRSGCPWCCSPSTQLDSILEMFSIKYMDDIWISLTL